MYLYQANMHVQLKIGIIIIVIVGLPLYVVGDKLIQNFQQTKIQNRITNGIIIKYGSAVIIVAGTTLAVRGGMKDSMKYRGTMDDLR
jgi:fumarate reductase subunit D